MTPDADSSSRPSFVSRIRNWLLTGLLVLAPSAITLYVFFRLINWVDNLLGRYLRFAAMRLPPHPRPRARSRRSCSSPSSAASRRASARARSGACGIAC